MDKIKKIQLFNIPIDCLTMQETLKFIISAIKKRKQLHHIVVNAGKIVAMQKDPEFFKSVINSDIINADGQAVIWASEFLNNPLPERVAGIDLMQNLVKIAAKEKFKIFLFGAKEEIVSKIAKKYQKLYSDDLIAGYRNGYFDKSEEENIAKQIARSKANLLFVAISSPVKENFLNKYKKTFKNVNFIMGVGGSFDVIAGKVKRAPVWMQKAGLEWFYRFLQEPRRMWKRYLLGNLEFVRLVLKERKKQKRQL